MTLPGVGRKTANLVLILSFRSVKNICVDTHVHRISNRLGWVHDPHAGGNRASALCGDRPALVGVINLYLVTWGQNVCRPVYPRCGACALREYCPQIGVTQDVEDADSTTKDTKGLRSPQSKS